MTVLGLLLCSAGCALDGDGKDSCVTQDDCVDGYTCVDRVCEGPPGGFGGGGDGGDGDDDGVVVGGGDGSVEEFGSVADISAATLGLTAVNDYQTLISITDVSGGLGCALVGDEDAAPGGAAAMLSLKPDVEGGDDRCPEGTHGILDNPDICGSVYPITGLNDGCAAYRAWDASGEPSAFRLATGGSVTVTATDTGEQIDCDVELSVDSFSFSYSPGAPDSAFCQH